jgi:hypothetical protein
MGFSIQRNDALRLIHSLERTYDKNSNKTLRQQIGDNYVYAPWEVVYEKNSYLGRFASWLQYSYEVPSSKRTILNIFDQVFQICGDELPKLNNFKLGVEIAQEFGGHSSQSLPEDLIMDDFRDLLKESAKIHEADVHKYSILPLMRKASPGIPHAPLSLEHLEAFIPSQTEMTPAAYDLIEDYLTKNSDVAVENWKEKLKLMREGSAVKAKLQVGRKPTTIEARENRADEAAQEIEEKIAHLKPGESYQFHCSYGLNKFTLAEVIGLFKSMPALIKSQIPEIARNPLEKSTYVNPEDFVEGAVENLINILQQKAPEIAEQFRNSPARHALPDENREIPNIVERYLPQIFSSYIERLLKDGLIKDIGVVSNWDTLRGITSWIADQGLVLLEKEGEAAFLEELKSKLTALGYNLPNEKLMSLIDKQLSFVAHFLRQYLPPIFFSILGFDAFVHQGPIWYKVTREKNGTFSFEVFTLGSALENHKVPGDSRLASFPYRIENIPPENLSTVFLRRLVYLFLESFSNPVNGRTVDSLYGENGTLQALGGQRVHAELEDFPKLAGLPSTEVQLAFSLLLDRMKKPKETTLNLRLHALVQYCLPLINEGKLGSADPSILQTLSMALDDIEKEAKKLYAGNGKESEDKLKVILATREDIRLEIEKTKPASTTSDINPPFPIPFPFIRDEIQKFLSNYYISKSTLESARGMLAWAFGEDFGLLVDTAIMSMGNVLPAQNAQKKTQGPVADSLIALCNALLIKGAKYALIAGGLYYIGGFSLFMLPMWRLVLPYILPKPIADWYLRFESAVQRSIVRLAAQFIFYCLVPKQQRENLEKLYSHWKETLLEWNARVDGTASLSFKVDSYDLLERVEAAPQRKKVEKKSRVAVDKGKEKKFLFDQVKKQDASEIEPEIRESQPMVCPLQPEQIPSDNLDKYIETTLDQLDGPYEPLAKLNYFFHRISKLEIPSTKNNFWQTVDNPSNTLALIGKLGAKLNDFFIESGESLDKHRGGYTHSIRHACHAEYITASYHLAAIGDCLARRNPDLKDLPPTNAYPLFIWLGHSGTRVNDPATMERIQQICQYFQPDIDLEDIPSRKQLLKDSEKTLFNHTLFKSFPPELNIPQMDFMSIQVPELAYLDELRKQPAIQKKLKEMGMPKGAGRGLILRNLLQETLVFTRPEDEQLIDPNFCYLRLLTLCAKQSTDYWYNQEPISPCLSQPAPSLSLDDDSTKMYVGLGIFWRFNVWEMKIPSNISRGVEESSEDWRSHSSQISSIVDHAGEKTQAELMQSNDFEKRLVEQFGKEGARQCLLIMTEKRDRLLRGMAFILANKDKLKWDCNSSDLPILNELIDILFFAPNALKNQLLHSPNSVRAAGNFQNELLDILLFGPNALKNQLTSSSDSARAIGNFLREMLEHFQKENDVPTCLWFIYKGLQIKKMIAWYAPERLHDLPDFYEQLEKLKPISSNFSPGRSLIFMLQALCFPSLQIIKEPKERFYAAKTLCTGLLFNPLRYSHAKQLTPLKKIFFDFFQHSANNAETLNNLLSYSPEALEAAVAEHGRLPEDESGEWIQKRSLKFICGDLSVDLNRGTIKGGISFVPFKTEAAEVVDITQFEEDVNLDKFGLKGIALVLQENDLEADGEKELPKGEERNLAKRYVSEDGQYELKIKSNGSEVLFRYIDGIKYKRMADVEELATSPLMSLTSLQDDSFIAWKELSHSPKMVVQSLDNPKLLFFFCNYSPSVTRLDCLDPKPKEEDKKHNPSRPSLISKIVKAGRAGIQSFKHVHETHRYVDPITKEEKLIDFNRDELTIDGATYKRIDPAELNNFYRAALPNHPPFIAWKELSESPRIVVHQSDESGESLLIFPAGFQCSDKLVYLDGPKHDQPLICITQKPLLGGLMPVERFCKAQETQYYIDPRSNQIKRFDFIPYDMSFEVKTDAEGISRAYCKHPQFSGYTLASLQNHPSLDAIPSYLLLENSVQKTVLIPRSAIPLFPSQLISTGWKLLSMLGPLGRFAGEILTQWNPQKVEGFYSFSLSVNGELKGSSPAASAFLIRHYLWQGEIVKARKALKVLEEQLSCGPTDHNMIYNELWMISFIPPSIEGFTLFPIEEISLIRLRILAALEENAEIHLNKEAKEPSPLSHIAKSVFCILMLLDYPQYLDRPNPYKSLHTKQEFYLSRFFFNNIESALTTELFPKFKKVRKWIAKFGAIPFVEQFILPTVMKERWEKIQAQYGVPRPLANRCATVIHSVASPLAKKICPTSWQLEKYSKKLKGLALDCINFEAAKGIKTSMNMPPLGTNDFSPETLKSDFVSYYALARSEIAGATEEHRQELKKLLSIHAGGWDEETAILIQILQAQYSDHGAALMHKGASFLHRFDKLKPLMSKVDPLLALVDPSSEQLQEALRPEYLNSELLKIQQRIATLEEEKKNVRNSKGKEKARHNQDYERDEDKLEKIDEQLGQARRAEARIQKRLVKLKRSSQQIDLGTPLIPVNQIQILKATSTIGTTLGTVCSWAYQWLFSNPMLSSNANRLASTFTVLTPAVVTLAKGVANATDYAWKVTGMEQVADGVSKLITLPKEDKPYSRPSYAPLKVTEESINQTLERIFHIAFDEIELPPEDEIKPSAENNAHPALQKGIEKTNRGFEAFYANRNPKKGVVLKSLKKLIEFYGELNAFKHALEVQLKQDKKQVIEGYAALCHEERYLQDMTLVDVWKFIDKYPNPSKGVSEEQVQHLELALAQCELKDYRLSQIEGVLKDLESLQKFVDRPLASLNSKELRFLEEKLEKISDGILAKTQFDFETTPQKLQSLYLRHQARLSKRLWVPQVKCLNAQLGAKEGNSTTELLCGRGKTATVEPIEAEFKADGKHLVFFIADHTVGHSVFSSFRQNLADIQATQQNHTRHITRYLETLEALRITMTAAIELGQPICMTREDVESLYAMLVDNTHHYIHVSKENNAYEKACLEQQREIMRLVHTTGCAIIDEPQVVYSANTILQWPLGDPKTMDEKWFNTTEMTMSYLLRHPVLNEAILKDSMFQISQEQYDGQIVPEIAQAIAKVFNMSSRLERTQFQQFITNECREIPDLILNHPQYAEICLVKGILTVLVRDQLKLRPSVDYGISKENNGEYARPHIGNGLPNEVETIQSPYEAMMKTFFTYAKQGLNIEQTQNLVKLLLAQAKEEMSRREVPLQKTKFFDLLNFKGENDAIWDLLKCADQIPEHSPKWKKIQQAINEKPEVVLLYVRHFVWQTMEYWIESIQVNSQQFSRFFPEQFSVSGTNYNTAAVLPPRVKEIENEETIGESLHEVHTRANKHVDVLPYSKHLTPKQIMKSIFHRYLSDPNCTMIVDGGALFTGLDSEYVARRMLKYAKKHRKDIEAVKFYPANSKDFDRIYVLSDPDGEPQPLESTNYSNEVCLSFFDQVHDFSANIPQAPTGFSVNTIGPVSLRYRMIQGAFRGLRDPAKTTQLQPLTENREERGRSIRFVTTQEVQKKIMDGLGKHSHTLSLNDAMDSAYRDELTALGEEALKAMPAKIKAVPFEVIFFDKMLPKATSFAEYIRLFKIFGDKVLIEKLEDDPRKLWGYVVKQKSTHEVLDAHAKQVIAEFADLPGLTKEEKAKIADGIAEIPYPDCLPSTVPVSYDGTSKTGKIDTGIRLNQRLKVKMKQQTHQQQQLQAEQQTITAPETGFSTREDKKWPEDSSPLSMDWLEFSLAEPRSGIKLEVCPMFKMQDALATSKNPALRKIAEYIDDALWFPNNWAQLQVEAPFAKPIELGSYYQYDLYQVLVQFKETADGFEILGMAPLSQKDASFWRDQFALIDAETWRNSEVKTLVYDVPNKVSAAGCPIIDIAKLQQDPRFKQCIASLIFISGWIKLKGYQKAMERWMKQDPYAFSEAFKSIFMERSIKKGKKEIFEGSDMASALRRAAMIRD